MPTPNTTALSGENFTFQAKKNDGGTFVDLINVSNFNPGGIEREAINNYYIASPTRKTRGSKCIEPGETTFDLGFDPSNVQHRNFLTWIMDNEDVTIVATEADAEVKCTVVGWIQSIDFEGIEIGSDVSLPITIKNNEVPLWEDVEE